MTIEDEWSKAWDNLEFHRKALAKSIDGGRPQTDPLRREQVKSLKRALAEYDKIVDQL